ncbi:ASCH domain-containing protein [Nonomuraea aridisoli]|nr:ASCH domain-containing protein [Nonomuraea aridisoli]
MDGLRVLELGTPGEVRIELTELTLSGAKTATAGLPALDYDAEGEAVERVGERLVLVDDSGVRAGEVEVTRVELVPFGEVGWEFAQAEGEGYTSVAHWRETHRRYWEGQGCTVRDDTTVVCSGSASRTSRPDPRTRSFSFGPWALFVLGGCLSWLLGELPSLMSLEVLDVRASTGTYLSERCS